MRKNQSQFKNRISVAPHFFNYFDYFEKSHAFLSKWQKKDFLKIRKQFGDKAIQAAVPGYDLDEIEKKANKSKHKGIENQEDEKIADILIAGYQLSELKTREKAFFSSFVIFIYSDFECILNDICSRIGKQSNSKITLKDVSGKGIIRAIRYLDIVAGLQLPTSEISNEVLFIQKIRNILVHAGGKTIDDYLISRAKKINEDANIESASTDGKYINLNEKFCVFVVTKLTEYLIDLVIKNPKHLLMWQIEGLKLTLAQEKSKK
jgi:hypothetical protein